MEPMKIFFNSLGEIYNFWIKFFPNDKKKEIIDLKVIKQTLENIRLNDFEIIQKKINFIFKNI